MKLTSLSPVLESRNLEETIEFYTNRLGFTVRGKLEEDGKPVWCDLVKDQVSIMFSTPNEKMNYGTIQLSGSIYINVEDVDTLWSSLKDCCEIVYPIENFVYEMREFAIKDNNGYVLNFGETLN